MTNAARKPSEIELAFLANRRVGRLATTSKDGTPSVVPFCYAVLDWHGEPVVASSLDLKPKSRPVREMQRVRNIAEQPPVAFVVDDYNDNWEALAFVQFQGNAELREPGSDGHAEAVALLKAKYKQYETMEIESRPLIWIDELRANAWSWIGDLSAISGRPPDLASLIRGRRSVRLLRPEPVPRDVLERAVNAAGWAPSPHGRQPWRFAIVESSERKLRLADAMASSWADQLQLDGQDDAIVQIRLHKSRARLLNAPALIVPSLFLGDLDDYPDDARQEAERMMAIQSLGAAIQNLLLSMYADGFDSGWMCAPLFCPDIVRDALDLDASLLPQALISVGKAVADPIRRPRRPVSELIVSWE